MSRCLIGRYVEQDLARLALAFIRTRTHHMAVDATIHASFDVTLNHLRHQQDATPFQKKRVRTELTCSNAGRALPVVLGSKPTITTLGLGSEYHVGAQGGKIFYIYRTPLITLPTPRGSSAPTFRKTFKRRFASRRPCRNGCKLSSPFIYPDESQRHTLSYRKTL